MEIAARVGGAIDGAPGSPPAVLELEGKPLSAVEFFGGEAPGFLLHFGGARLEVLAPVEVFGGEGVPAADAAALRAALNQCRDARVVRVLLVRGRDLTLGFDNGSTVRICLDATGHAGPEAAAFFDEEWRYEAY